MHAIPLPPFTFMLLGGAAATFLVCGLLLLAFRQERSEGGPGAALLPFAIPVGVTACVVLVVTSIGVLLLSVGKTIAVPLAVMIAVVVLVVAGIMSQTGSSSQAQH